jgi:hypothetical protein
MRATQKFFFLSIIILLIPATVYCTGWGESQQDPIRNEYNMLDLFIARPLGVAAGIAGTGLFILSLPFTIPTGGVNEAARMFVNEPFRFSLKREYPDPNF